MPQISAYIASDAAEGGSAVPITISLTTAAPAGGLTISFFLSGTATPGDYALAPGSGITALSTSTVQANGVAIYSGEFTVAAGATTATLLLTAVNDSETESDRETVIFNLMRRAESDYTLASASMAFESTSLLETAPSNPHVTVGDFNGDGHTDILGVNEDAWKVSLLLGNGDGTFGPALHSDTNGVAGDAAVGDFNHDGFADIAGVMGGSSRVYIMLGNSTGLGTASSANVGDSPRYTAVGDFNGDGNADIATANLSGSVSVLLGYGDGTFREFENYTVGTTPTQPVAVDVNRDGRDDIVVTDMDTAQVHVLLANPNGALGTPTTYATDSSPQGITTGDFNRDGSPDFAVANRDANSVSLFLGDGSGNFTPTGSLAVGAGPTTLSSADIDGDRILDLVVANRGSGTVQVLKGAGDGTFTNVGAFALGSDPYGIATGDFNEDGIADVVTGPRTGAGVTVGLSGPAPYSTSIFDTTAASDWYEYGGHHYELVKSAVSFQEALRLSETRKYQGMQGHLLTISDHAESLALWQQFVFPYYYTNEKATPWIALSDSAVEGTWVWMAGPEKNTIATFTDWAGGEPNNLGNEDYAVLHWQRKPGGWFDYPAYVPEWGGQWFIVEYEPWGYRNSSPSGAVFVTGDATQGKTLRAVNTLTDDDGIPTTGQGAIGYQWAADGVAIAGATGAQFTLTQAEVGKKISVTATYTDELGTAESVASDQTSGVVNVNDAPTGNVSILFTRTNRDVVRLEFEGIDGSNAFGSGLTPVGSPYISDSESVDGSTSAYFAGNGSAIRFNIATLDIQAADFGIDFYFKTDGSQNPWSVLLSSVREGLWGEINNNATRGGYVWFYDGGVVGGGFVNDNAWHHVVAGQTGNQSYLILDDVLQGSVTSTVSNHDFSDLILGKLGGQWISNSDNSFRGWIDTFRIYVPEEAPLQGQTLTASVNLADADGLGTLHYQWLADGQAIAGATGAALLLGQAEVGKAINVLVSYQDGGGFTEQVLSSPTSRVLDAAFETTGSVTVRGVARQGETLTAVSTLADLDGLTLLSYQWLADGVAIDGANASALTLTQDQVGKSISVAVSYVEGDGASGTVTASARVIASPLDLAQSIGYGFVSGSLHEMTGSGGGQAFALAINAATRAAVAVWMDEAGQFRWMGTVGGAAQLLTSADINGDGRPDLIARDSQGRYGTFLLDAPWTPYDVSSSGMYLPEFVSSGLDQAQVGNLAGTALVNGDAFVDLILMSDNGWSVALGNGSGEFSPTGVTHELDGNQWSGNQGAQILSADFNHDGHTDLVVNARFASHLEVWLGDGEGGFSESFDISSYFLYSVDIGDLNDDGHQDLVVSGRTYLGDGTGSFQPGAQIVVPDGRSVYATRIADFNADGIQDVALAMDSDGVILAIGNGQGGFSSQTQIGQGSGELTSLLAMDMNGDGLTDLVASGWLTGTKVFYSTEVAAAVVANVNDRPTGSVTIAGVARVGNTLQAGNTLADLDGMGAVSYQWRIDGQDIAGATASTYQLQAGDAGRQVSVVAQYTDLTGNLESVASSSLVIGISLTGTSGSDRLVGSGGDDLITGGLGTDAMDGGNGSDLYLVGTSSEHTAAEIADSGTSGVDELRFAATTASTLTLFAGDTGIERVTLGTGNGTSAITTGSTALNLNASAVLNALTLQGNDGANTLTGTAFADTLLGGGGNDALTGGGGNDTLTGDLGIDTFTVAAGTDTVTDLGQGGADVLKVSAGASALATVHTAWTATSASSNAGTANLSTSGLAVNLAAITTGLGFAVINTGAATTLTGSALADTLTGGSGNDSLLGGGGNDSLQGASGDDSLTGGAGNDTMDGGEGSDLYILASTTEHTAGEVTDSGTSGIDELRFAATTAGTLTLFAGDTGLEIVTLGTGTSAQAVTNGLAALNVNASAVLNALTLQGNDGTNTLTGTAFDDTLLGGGGNDALTGGSGNDTLTGGLGVDTFTVAAGTDTVTDLGQGGADVLKVSAGASALATVHTAWTATSASSNAGSASLSTSGLAVNLAAITTGLGFAVTNTGAATTLTGSALADTLTGGSGNDILTGGAGNDTLTGSGGDDLITGGLGTDAMDGGEGSDLYILASTTEHTAGEVTDSGNSGIDELRFAATTAATLTLFAGDIGIERVTLGTGNGASAITTGSTALNLNASAVLNALTLQGNDGANTLTGTAFDDTLLGGGGNDALTGGSGNDTLTGGLGVDTFTVAAGTDTVTDLGQGGADVLKVSAGASALATVHTAWTATSASSNAGTANLSTSGLAVNLAAITTGLGFAVTNTGAATTLTGSALADTLTGGSGNDILTGGAGNDTLTGSGGDDLITGGLGTDAMDGGEGSDLYILASTTEHTAGEVTDSGNSGIDELRFAATTAATLTLFAGDTGIERVTLGTGNGASAITTGSTALNLNASAVLNALTLQGNDGANTLTGTAFADTLLGGGGNDVLTGGDGNDVLRGGLGNDSLTGGGGIDRFVFDTLPNATTNRDTITDFAAGLDVIQLSRTVFAALGLGETLGIEQFLSSSTATRGMDADDRIIYNTASGALYYDQDGSGAAAAVQIALLGATSHPFIGYQDFQVIT